MSAENPRPEFMDLWSFRDPAGTEASFRELLPEARARADASHLAQLLSQVARAQGMQHNFEGAHRTLDEVEALLRGEHLPVARLRYLLERGRAFDSPAHPKADKQPDRARPLFTEAFESGRETDLDALALDASHMLGIIEPPAEALAWNLRSIEIAEQSQCEKARGWLGPLYNNTGWTLHDAGEYDRALQLFVKGLAFRQAKGQERETRIAKWCVGRAFRSLGRVDEALALQRELLEDWKASGEEEAGYVAEELGECLLALGRSEGAQSWFGQAHARLKETNAWLLDEEPERMARLERLASDGGHDAASPPRGNGP